MLEGIEHYKGREQSWVKHYVLSKYLAQFGQIIGFHWSSITYVDGFCGPWNVQSDDLSDTSFSIALEQLRNAQKTHGNLRVRCVFCEPNRTRFKKLSAFAAKVRDEKIEINLLNTEFEDAIPDIIQFIGQGQDTFSFCLIDPTGWTGFSMQKIVPLLRLPHSEVLITFMLEFIRRFFGHTSSRESFEQLTGEAEFPEYINSLSGIDRDDAIAEFYRGCLKKHGGLDYVQRFIVLNPSKAKSHFELMYGTRHVKGIEAFKNAEKEAMPAQEELRASIEIQKRDQPLFDPEDMGESVHYAELKNRYLEKSKKSVLKKLSSDRCVPYDELWIEALYYPIVWKSDLDKWLEKWRDDGLVQWKGMKPRERTLKRGAGHSVERIADLLIE